MSVKDKRLIVICLFVVIIFVVLSFKLSIQDSLNDNNNNTSKIYIKSEEQLDKELKNDKDMLLFFYDKSIYLYKNASILLDFYSEIYNLTFYYLDTQIISENELEKKFNFETDFLDSPGVILIKNGKMVACANYMLDDIFLKEVLQEYNFIDESNNNDNAVWFDGFNNLFISKKKNVVLIYSYIDDKQIEIRKILNDKSKKYKFNYNVVYYGFNDSFKTEELIMKSINKTDIPVPGLYIVGNNKIIDYIEIKSEEDINKFLKKHKYT